MPHGRVFSPLPSRTSSQDPGRLFHGGMALRARTVRLFVAVVLFLPAACVEVTEVPLENGKLKLYDTGSCRFEFNDLVPDVPNP